MAIPCSVKAQADIGYFACAYCSISKMVILSLLVFNFTTYLYLYAKKSDDAP